MSTSDYILKGIDLLKKIESTQKTKIHEASQLMADSIEKKRWVYLFGSGHSVIPVLDVFPRYGSYVGFRPLMDPRLMWFNVTGPGGAPELLWLERQEGYIASFLSNYNFTSEDTLIVYSHGGLNAAPVEAAIYARESGTKVIAVTSLDNYSSATAQHSSGKMLADAADIVLDNCVPLEDSLVDIGQLEKVAAGSTLAVVTISMCLVAETAKILSNRGIKLETFVSANVRGVAPNHNQKVFEKYRARLKND